MYPEKLLSEMFTNLNGTFRCRFGRAAGYLEGDRTGIVTHRCITSVDNHAIANTTINSELSTVNIPYTGWYTVVDVREARGRNNTVSHFVYDLRKWD